MIRYSQAPDGRASQLSISGASERTLERLEDPGAIEVLGRRHIYALTPLVGESTRRAVGDADEWVESRRATRSDARLTRVETERAVGAAREVADGRAGQP